MTKTVLRRVFLLTLALVGLLAGCATKDSFTPGQVYRDWTYRLSEMGILPVFPPREDVVVGDVYLLPMHPGANALAGHVGGLGMAGIHLGYLDVVNDWSSSNQTTASLEVALENFYRSRPAFPPTPVGSSLSNLPPMVGVPGTVAEGTNPPPGVFQSRRPVRLKQVAFPEFTVTTSSQVGLSALIPIEGIMAGGGFNFSKVQKISVKIPQAESYGLSSDWLLTDFIQSFVKTGSNVAGKSQLYLLSTDQPDGNLVTNAPLASISALLARAMFDQTLTRSLNERIESTALRNELFDQVELSKDQLYITLITEVFYARAMDINIEFAKGAAGGLAARPVTVADLKELANLGAAARGATNGGSGAVTISNSAPTLEAKSGEDAVALAERLRNLNMSQTGPGGSVKVVGASSRNVGLRRVFEYPIAVGVRGVVLRIAKTAEIFTESGLPASGKTQRGFPIQLDTFEQRRK